MRRKQSSTIRNHRRHGSGVHKCQNRDIYVMIVCALFACSRNIYFVFVCRPCCKLLPECVCVCVCVCFHQVSVTVQMCLWMKSKPWPLWWPTSVPSLVSISLSLLQSLLLIIPCIDHININTVYLNRFQSFIHHYLVQILVQKLARHCFRLHCHSPRE